MRSRILRSCSVRRASRSSSSGGWRIRSSTRAGHSGIEQRLAGGDTPDRVDEVGAPDLLEQVAGRAGHDRVEQRLVVGERRQHQALQRRDARADVAAHLDAVAVGEPHVEDRDVGRGRPGSAASASAAVPASPTTSMVVLDLEQLAHPAPDHSNT